MALPLIALKEAIKDQPPVTAAPTAVVIPRVENGTATPQGEEQKTGWWWWYNPFLWSPWWWYWGPQRRRA